MFKIACENRSPQELHNLSSDLLAQECIDATLAVLIVDEVIESENEQGSSCDPEAIVSSALELFSGNQRGKVSELRTSLGQAGYAMKHEDIYVIQIEKGNIDLEGYT